MDRNGIDKSVVSNPTRDPTISSSERRALPCSHVTPDRFVGFVGSTRGSARTPSPSSTVA